MKLGGTNIGNVTGSIQSSTQTIGSNHSAHRPDGSSMGGPWPRVAVILLLLVIYVGAAFRPALTDDADSTHAEAAREMLVRSDYVTLHVNGIRYLEKAPLPYWLVAFSFRIFGINAFAVRFPIALAVLLSGMLAMAWATRAFGQRPGVYAGLFTATAVGFFLFTRIMIPEAILSLLIAASLYYFLTALDRGGPWRWYAGYVCVALAVLTKGLVALVFVGATAFCYLLMTGQWRRWKEFRILSGLAVLLAVAAPWHLLAGIRNHGFFWFYFVNEHFLRFLGKRYPRDYNKLPSYLYWSLQLVWLFPWSIFIPNVLGDLWRNFKRRPRAPEEFSFATQTRLLCFIWAVIILLFFSISTNQEYYTFPAYLPLLILAAAAIAKAEEQGTNRWLVWSTGIIAVLSLIFSAVLTIGLWESRHLPYVSDIGVVLTQNYLANDTAAMSHMLDLQAQSFAALRLPAILAAFALALGPSVAFVLRLRKRHYPATWLVASAMAVLLIAANIAYARFEPYLSSKGLAQTIASQLGPEDKVAVYGDQANATSLLIYLQRPLFLVNGSASSMWFGSTFPDAPRVFWNDSDLVREWNSNTRIFLFVPSFLKSRVDTLLPSSKFVVAESSGKTIYSNRP